MAGGLLVLLLGLTPMALRAQSMEDFKNSTPEERAQMQTEYLKTNLGLDEQQTQKVSGINLKYAEKMQSVLQGSGGRFAKMKAAKSVNQEKDAELKQVFTSEQAKKYDEMKAEMKAKMKEAIKERKAQRS